MKVYVYVLTVDDGTAPCVDNGVFTLACCKPDIRRCADEKDWIVGIAGKELTKCSGRDNIGRIIYVAQVIKKESWADYGKMERFKGRRDNVYYFDETDKAFKRKPEMKQLHMSDKDMQKDVTNGEFVLISDATHFRYFGNKAEKSLDEFDEIISERIRNGKGQQKHKVYPNSKHGLAFAMRFVESMVKIGNSDVQGEPHGCSHGRKACSCQY